MKFDNCIHLDKFMVYYYVCQSCVILLCGIIKQKCLTTMKFDKYVDAKLLVIVLII